MKIQSKHREDYLTNRLSEIEKLKEEFLVLKFNFALLLGHKLKGSAATFGFDSIGEIAIELEVAAKNLDQLKIQKLIAQLESEVHREMKNLKSADSI